MAECEYVINVVDCIISPSSYPLPIVKQYIHQYIHNTCDFVALPTRAGKKVFAYSIDAGLGPRICFGW